VPRLFVLRTIRTLDYAYHVWTIRSLDDSHNVLFVPWTFRTMDFSYHTLITGAILTTVIRNKSGERFTVERGKKCESNLILLNKPNTELSRFMKKKKQKQRKMVCAVRFEPQSTAWLLAMLPIEPCKHSVGVVYCTF